MALMVQVKFTSSSQGLQPQSKLLLDETTGGSLMLKSAEDVVSIIDSMALNDRKANHNRSTSQRKPVILELGSNDVVLAQNKLFTQQIEEMKKEMKNFPTQIKEQLQREREYPQVNSCELCVGDHPTGYCPPPYEEEVHYVGNQQRPNQYQGQHSGNSNQGKHTGNLNQGRYPGNNNNFPRGNHYGQPLRPNGGAIKLLPTTLPLQ